MKGPDLVPGMARDLEDIFSSDSVMTTPVRLHGSFGRRLVQGHLDIQSGDVHLAEHSDVRQSASLMARSIDLDGVSAGDTVEAMGDPTVWWTVARAPEHDGGGVGTVGLGPYRPTPDAPDPSAPFRA